MPADLNDYFNKNKKNDKNDNKNGQNMPNFDLKMPNFNGFGKFSGVIYFFIFVILILFVTKPFVIINSGEVGIKSNLGKFQPEPLDPGFHIFVPFIQKVYIVDTKVRMIDYTSGSDNETFTQNSGILRKDSIAVMDARNLPVNIDLSVQYKLNKKTAPLTIAEYGPTWESKIVDRVVLDVVKSIIGKYTAENLPTKRNEIANAINEDISAKINALDNKPVDLQTVQLRDIILSNNIKEQIERVQIAKQEAERTKYEVERANQEALKKAAIAEGTAKAIKIEAQGKAQAILIEANATAIANKEIARSLDSNLLNLKQIETQGKFNEALRENKDAKIFLTPGGAVPNIWVDTKDKAKQSAIND